MRVSSMRFSLPSVLIFVLLLVACSADGARGQQEAGGPEVSVVTTIYPWQYLAQRIGGDRVRVVNLTPTGAEPHDWEPTARDVLSIRNADLFIHTGAGLEPWVERALGEIEVGEVEALNISTALSGFLLKVGEEDAVDPHFWLDPGLYAQLATQVRQTLVVLDSEGSDEYQGNFAALQQELMALGGEMDLTLEDCESNVLVTTHAAFGYFSRRLGAEQIPIAGLSPESEPSPARLREVAAQAQRLGVKYIFYESLASTRAAETLAREVGAGTLELNPLEGLTPRELDSGEDYFSIMHSNLDNLKRGLGCR